MGKRGSRTKLKNGLSIFFSVLAVVGDGSELEPSMRKHEREDSCDGTVTTQLDSDVINSV